MGMVAVFNPGTRVKLGEFDGTDFQFHELHGSIGGSGRNGLLALVGVIMARQFDLEVDGVLLECCRLVRRGPRFEFVYASQSRAPVDSDVRE